MICVSAERAPNCLRKSRSVSTRSSSGIWLPSLNRSGSRISNRRCKLLILGGAFHDERNPFQCHRPKSVRWHGGFTGIPRLEREPAEQVAKSPSFHFGTWEVDDDHGSIVANLLRKRNCGAVPASTICLGTTGRPTVGNGG